MKFTLAWLKQHLDTKASVEAIAETLTRIGLEVEELFDPKTALKPFRVAEVVKCEKHPNADKLRSARSIPAASACRWCAARPMRGPA